MALRATSHARSADPVRLRRLAALLAAALLGGAAFGGAAEQAAAGGLTENIRVCGDRATLLEQFATQHDEKPQALGLGADGGVIEVLVSPEGGWTMLVTYPQRPTCVIAMGEAWEILRLAGEAS
jgi:hypothetical protein